MIYSWFLTRFKKLMIDDLWWLKKNDLYVMLYVHFWDLWYMTFCIRQISYDICWMIFEIRYVIHIICYVWCHLRYLFVVNDCLRLFNIFFFQSNADLWIFPKWSGWAPIEQCTMIALLLFLFFVLLELASRMEDHTLPSGLGDLFTRRLLLVFMRLVLRVWAMQVGWKFLSACVCVCVLVCVCGRTCASAAVAICLVLRRPSSKLAKHCARWAPWWGRANCAPRALHWGISCHRDFEKLTKACLLPGPLRCCQPNHL